MQTLNFEDYLEVNQKLWNQKTPIHLKSDFYRLEAFKKGWCSLNDIELALLGDVSGKKILHLQCHFGQDSLSLARRGAEVTGVDFSGEALAAARQLSDELDIPARFLQANTRNLDAVLSQEPQFDLIYASYGVIGWHPEINTLVQQATKRLHKGGRFLLVEFHPVAWMFGDNFQKIAYPYRADAPFYEEEEGTYADTSAPIKQGSYFWSHGLSDVFQAYLGAGLQISHFSEYMDSPYDIFAPSVKTEKGYQVRHLQNMLPLVYALEGRK